MVCPFTWLGWRNRDGVLHIDISTTPTPRAIGMHIGKQVLIRDDQGAVVYGIRSQQMFIGSPKTRVHLPHILLLYFLLRHILGPFAGTNKIHGADK